MQKETKQCQSCKNQFAIEPEDFDFYAKIKVPPPTWCPECRMARRLSFRNERVLFPRNCDLCKKRIISMFSSKASFPVYCSQCFWGDRWDGLSYGRDYDFSRPFFEQFKGLLSSAPRINLMEFMNENSEYANYVYKNKRTYLSYSIIESQNIFYSWAVDYSSDCFDCYQTQRSELCYECINIERCYRSSHLLRSKECSDSHFLVDCTNCRNCFLSDNLRNKEYVFKNQQFSKEEYSQKVGDYFMGSRGGIEKARLEFEEMKQKSLHRYAHLTRSVNSTGENVINSKNANYCFDSQNCEDLKFSFRCIDEKDSMDVFGGGPAANHSYDCLSDGLRSSMLKFTLHSWEDVFNATYCDLCHNVSNVFGCASLRKKQYCILNKQYTKEEYEELVPKIIKHMNDMPYVDSKGKIYKYGEFFPPELSSFAYNETIAQEYFPLIKEEAVKRGYKWKDDEPRNYEITVKSKDLQDNIKDVDDSVLKETIRCQHDQKCNQQCTQAFRIIPDELSFYKRMNLPLPRLCPNCRHYERLKQKNPYKLWHRKCQCAGSTSSPQAGSKSESGVYSNTIAHSHGANPCPNEFETSYAPERPEIVYCETCYNAEVV